MTADSSFGNQGDIAKFYLPLNATTNQNLKFRYRNTGRSVSLKLQVKDRLVHVYAYLSRGFLHHNL